MSDEEKKPNKSISFGTFEGTANIVDGDQQTGGEQIKAETIENLDKSQTSHTETHVAGDMHGDIKGGDNIQGGAEITMEQAVEDLFEKMKAEAGPAPIQPRAIPKPDVVSESAEPVEAPEPVEVDIQEFEELEIPDFEDGSDHPELVYSAMQAMPPSAPPEEQKSWFQRACSCVKKYATSNETKAVLSTIAGGIEVVAGGLPFPYNLAHYVCKRISGGGS